MPAAEVELNLPCDTTGEVVAMHCNVPAILIIRPCGVVLSLI